MIAFFTDGFPLRQVVGALLFDIGLRVCSVCAVEFLGNGILDFYGLDLFVQSRERIPPC